MLGSLRTGASVFFGLVMGDMEWVGATVTTGVRDCGAGVGCWITGPCKAVDGDGD